MFLQAVASVRPSYTRTVVAVSAGCSLVAADDAGREEISMYSVEISF